MTQWFARKGHRITPKHGAKPIHIKYKKGSDMTGYFK